MLCLTAGPAPPCTVLQAACSTHRKLDFSPKKGVLKFPLVERGRQFRLSGRPTSPAQRCRRSRGKTKGQAGYS